MERSFTNSTNEQGTMRISKSLFPYLPAILMGIAGCQKGPVRDQPNIILVYVDDMGIGDASFTGGKVGYTPHIDQLASEGKVFTRYYSNAPVCSPSRVAVTTGMYPIRWNINTFLSSRKFNRECEQSDYLDSAAPSMGRVMKAAGYRTAHFGKWHMGGGRDVKDAPDISTYGFDEWSSTWESPNPDPLLTSSNWIWAPTDSIKRWERSAYFVDKTLDFLERNSGQPCFINLWPDDVHSPWVASADAIQEDRKEYYTLPNLKPVVDEFDVQVGRLMEGLKKLGIEQNTLVIFTSDNGPAPSFERLRTNGIRGIKNSLYEGGILMPFIVHWPEVVEGGQVDSTTVLAAMDLLPTLCRIAGASLPTTHVLDGEDMSKAFTGAKPCQRENDIFWEYGRNERYNYPVAGDRSPQLAIRHGKWKFYTNPDGGKTELYDLEADPKEEENLAGKNPALAHELKQKAIAWYNRYDKEFCIQYTKKPLSSQATKSPN